MALGNFLKSARKAKGLNQYQSARLIGISQGTVSKYENDEIEPSIREAHKISVAYEVTMTQIIRALIGKKKKKEVKA